jgi:DNA replication protein DnaC
MDIFEALEAEGVDISYSTVLRTIRGLEQKAKEAYIKASYTPGDICEDLSIEYLPEDAQKKLKLLKTLEFIQEGRNLILAGNPGTGNYRKCLVMERNERTSHYINDCSLISFDNTSK